MPEVRSMDELRVSSETLQQRSRVATVMANESLERARRLREQSDRLHVLNHGFAAASPEQRQENA
ncbi:hypothetical protein RA29_18865 [Tateyamaria sp. ANG-S1]|nr:hypothetical protein RA29_18865 [Tateyamaria sp. ANG-S1]